MGTGLNAALKEGRFITFEGIDGAGKSSHIGALADWLRANGVEVVLTREPGGTELAETLRALILHQPMDPLTEALLVFAARRDHLSRLIVPALQRGAAVLCDRFTDASYAYQGGGRGFDKALLMQLEEWVQQGRQPDLTLWFDLPAATAAERRAAVRAPDRFETQDQAFFERVRAGYAERAAAAPARFAIIDAQGERSQVWARVQQAVNQRGLVLTAAALLVQADGSLPLPWLQGPLQQVLHSHRGHALLVQGSPGVGALAFALVLAQSWLCESATAGQGAERSAALACGHCGSCRLFQSHVHPDLLVLMPETLRQQHAWPMSGDKPDADDSKKKPSRQIRIDEVRAMLDWAGKTSSRGRGKVVVLHPAEALNLQSANALLKTLEEPAPGTRLVFTVSDSSTLLPTVRSRCQQLRLAAPDGAQAQAWLAGQGVEAAAALLAACSGRPLDALALAQTGVDGAAWARLPQAVARGQAGVFAGWAVPRVLDALQKVCHDTMATAAGAEARFFPAGALPAAADVTTPAALAALGAWSEALARVARHAEHPWNEPLLVEALVTAGARALKGRR